MNKLKTVQFPLSKANEAVVKKHFKQQNNLSSNARDEKVLGILKTNDTQKAFKKMANQYNGYVKTHNALMQIRKDTENIVRTENNKEAMNFLDSISNFINELILEKAQKKNKDTFIIHLVIQKTYLKTWYEGTVKIAEDGEVITKNETTPPMTEYKEKIPEIVETYNFNDGYTETEVLSYSIEYMDVEGHEKNKKSKNQSSNETGFYITE